MVGPGTGVVPFIGFLQEREVEIKLGKVRASAHLFFGCRKSTTDFIYKTDILEHEANQILTKSYLAFSRESEIQKVYVQDLMRQQADFIKETLLN
jgi:sulfite reductase alpha subunit-like flavoprotein